MSQIRFLWTHVEYCLHRARATDREAGQSVEHVLWYILGAGAVILIAGGVYAAILAKSKEGIGGP